MLDTSNLTPEKPAAKKRSLVRPDVEGPLCPSVLLGEENCSRSCQLSHEWSWYNAPTCVQLMSGFCPWGHNCKLGHQHALALYGTWVRCERFEEMGFCERGQNCPKVHLWNTNNLLSRACAFAESGDRKADQSDSCNEHRENVKPVQPENVRLSKEKSHQSKKRIRNSRYWKRIASSDGEDESKMTMKRQRVEEVASSGPPIALGDYVPL